MASSLRITQTTINPKSIHYHSNGQGRDQYIQTTCGGLYKHKPDTCTGFEIGTFNGKSDYKVVNNYRPAKHIHYHSDGTGRDNYIVTDEGGLAGNSYSRHNYLKNLRQYMRKSEMKQNDYFQRSQSSFFSQSERKKMTNLQRRQYNTSLRLSQPRFIVDPYSEVRAQTTLPGLRRLY